MAETAAPKGSSLHQESLPRSAGSGARASAGSAVTDAGIPDGLAGEGVTARSRRSSHRVGGAGTGSPADGEGGCAEQAHAQVQQVEQQAESDGLFAGDVERAEEEHEGARSEEHTSELQSLIRISYAVFCFNNKKILSILHLYF